MADFMLLRLKLCKHANKTRSVIIDTDTKGDNIWDF